MAFSFAATGLNDEPLAPSPPQTALSPQLTQHPDPMTQLGMITRAIADAVKPQEGKTKTARERCRYDGVFCQDDDGGKPDFELLTKREHRSLIDEYDIASGGGIPEDEEPTLKQLSAVLGKLDDDDNPAPDFAVLGPFGDRTAKFVAKNTEVTEGGEKKRRRVRGPDSFAMWRPSFRIFRGPMLILKASPAGPLDAYEKLIHNFNERFPDHWSIVSFAEQTNRTEKWSKYRRICEDLARRGNPAKYWDEDQPWAAVIHMALSDRDWWEDMIEKPISFGKDERGAAEQASRFHRGYLPATAVDGYDIMMRLDQAAVAGPYEARRARGWGAGQPPIASAAFRSEWQMPYHQSSELSTQTSESRDQEGRLRCLKVYGIWKNFCYKFNRASRGCADTNCERLHRCEFCTSNKHKTTDCPGKGKADKCKGKSKGKSNGKASKGKKDAGRPAWE